MNIKLPLKDPNAIPNEPTMFSLQKASNTDVCVNVHGELTGIFQPENR
jgi:hypothetical protein